jgi:hypothetical protein
MDAAPSQHPKTPMMLEASAMMGWFSAVLLVGAFAACLMLGRGPLLQRLDRRRTQSANQAENAARLLAIAFAASAVAAILSVAGLMFG